MSWVTNTILHFGCLDGDHEMHALEHVNAFFKQRNDSQRFVSVQDESLPRDWYGGSKRLECSLAIGAFNHLEIGALVEHLCSLCAADKLDPVATQLILMDQEEEKFRVINLEDELVARGIAPPWLQPRPGDDEGSNDEGSQ